MSSAKVESGSQRYASPEKQRKEKWFEMVEKNLQAKGGNEIACGIGEVFVRRENRACRCCHQSGSSEIVDIVGVLVERYSLVGIPTRMEQGRTPA